MKLFATLFRRLTGYLDNPKLIAESMERYDWITSGNADPLRVSPAHTRGRLGQVPEDKAVTEALERDYQAKRDQDGWVVPTNLPHAQMKKLKRLWVRTPDDLVGMTSPTRLMPDGNPVTDEVLVEEFGKGGEPTAVPLLLVSLPVCTVLLLFAMHVGQHISGTLGALLSILPVCGIAAALYSLEQMYTVGKMVKSGIIGVALPLVMLTLFPTGFQLGRFMPLLSQHPVAAVGGFVILVVLLAIVQGAGRSNSLTQGQAGVWNKGLDGLKHAFWWLVIFGGLDFAIQHLPGMLHGLVWFVPGCLMPLRHADEFWRWRAEELLQQEASAKADRYVHSFDPDGPVQGAFREQIVRAARDTTPLMVFGTSTGSLGRKRRTPFFMSNRRAVALSVLDLSMHFMAFGETGSGKTTSLARPMLYQWVIKHCGGALVQCGKGQLPFDVDALIDIKLKPGFNWAPIQGMDGVQLGAALKSFKPSGKAVKDSDEGGAHGHWNDGANLVVNHVAYIQDQCFKHELKIRRADRIKAAKMTAKLLMLDIQEMDGHDLSDEREKAQLTLVECRETLGQVRVYPWTYGANWRTLQACEAVIPQGPTKRLEGKELAAIKGFLGVTTGQTTLTDEEFRRRKMHQPERIHPETQQVGSTLMEALNYIKTSYVELAEDTRTSYWSNIAMMFSPLMSTGTVFANADGVPWMEIEQGETLADVFKGKRAGVYLNTDTYGAAALIVNQLSRAYIYSGLRRRPDDWAKDPSQKNVLILIDECHMVIGKAESDLVTTIRSKGGTFFFLTQGIGQLLSTAGFAKHEAYAMLNQFASLCALKTDADTVEYLEQRAPIVWVTGTTGYTSIGTGHIDVEGAVSKLADSPLENRALEQHSHYQRMERADGFGRFSIVTEETKKLANQGGFNFRHWNRPYREISAISSGTLLDEKGNPVFEDLVRSVDAKTIQGGLITKGDGSAIWIATRGGAPRVDFVKLTPMTPEDVLKALASHKPTQS